MNRRKFLLLMSSSAGVLGSSAGKAVGPITGAQPGDVGRGLDTQPPEGLRPDNLFSNINQVQRHKESGVDDLKGRTRFPMLDTRQVREAEDVRLQFHAAQKHGGPVMVADRPWEIGVQLYGSVLHDGQRFRMWYQPTPPKAQVGNPYDVGYAESLDGVHWEKPELRLVEASGSYQNNLVPLRGHSPSVIDLGAAAPPERRFLGVTIGSAAKLGIPEVLKHEQTKTHHGYWLYYSADGLDWKIYPPPTCAILSGMADTCCFVADPYRGRVLGSLKLEPRIGLYDRRSVAITTARMKDVHSWEPCRLMLFPDELDDRMARERGCRLLEFYGMGMLVQRDVVIGFPEAFWVEGALHPFQDSGIRIGYHGKGEIQMAYSYDGYAWQRPSGRQAFIPLGKAGEWDDGFLTLRGTVVEAGDDVFVYYSGNRGGHAVAEETSRCKIGLAKIKRDRFASIVADSEGMVEVYHGAPAGRGIVLNARTASDGVIRVEVREPVEGRPRTPSKPIVGFTASDCRPISGDGVRLPINWSNKGWGDLAGNRPIALRFVLKNAEIFGYEVQG